MFGIMIEFAYFEGKEQSVYEEVFEFKTERAALDFFNHLLCSHVEYDFSGKGDRNGKHVECDKLLSHISNMSDGESFDMTIALTRNGKASRTDGMDFFQAFLIDEKSMEHDHRNSNCWTHDFTFNFSFSGLSADWETDISAADIRARIITSLGNCDAADLLQRVECYNSFSEREV